MNRRRQAGLFLLVAALAGAAGFLSNWAKPNFAVIERAAQTLSSTAFADLSGKLQTLSQWKGKVLVVNFWATWCAPCREEIPALIKTQKKYAAKGVQLVGIGIDNVSKIREYMAEMNIDYVLLIGDMEALNLTNELGNRAGVLPFTVILDRFGKVAYTHAGALTDAVLDAALAPLL